jgi:hypothetical protein
MADLTWLGTFKSPGAVAANGGSVTYPHFTLRRVGGQLKMLWLGTSHGGNAPPYELIQVDYPGFAPVLADSPASESNVRNFGNGFMRLTIGEQSRSLANSVIVNGIHWDARNNCVWVMYGDTYNTTGFKDPVLIRGDINDAAPDATAVRWSGPWRLNGSVSGSSARADSHQTQSYVVSVPPKYGSTYLEGATIALGGTYSSGGRASPYNNVLWAPKLTPGSATPSHAAGGPDLEARCLIGGDMAAGHRGRRPGDYITESCGRGGDGDTDPTSYTRSSLTGYWNVLDYVGSAVWLDWDTVRGALFLVAHGRGHIWYNSAGLQGGGGHCNHGVQDRYSVTGPESVVDSRMDREKIYGSGPDMEAALYAYDPDKFVPVAGGNPWSVPVHDWAYLLDRFPSFAVCKDVGVPVVVKPNGMAADETSRLLMIPCGYVTGGST